MQVQSFAAPVTAIRQTVSADIPLPAVVDQLADVQTAIAVLANLEANLKATLIRSGLTEICGTNIRAKVIHINESKTVAWKDVATYLKAPAEVIELFSSKKDPYDKVQLYGYNA